MTSRKLVNIALVYTIAGLIAGIIFREVTKAFNFSGTTQLSFTHPHLIGLGAFVFVLLALVNYVSPITSHRFFHPFMLLYNIGLVITVAMMFVFGTYQVTGVLLAPPMDAALSGVAGIGHILIAVGLVLMVLMVRDALSKK